MTEIVHILRQIVQHELGKIRIGELGVVTSVFPHSDKGDKDNYECNVKLKDNDLELRKVPIATNHIGTVAVPRVNDLVIISFIHGDVNQPVITGRLYNDEDRPPMHGSDEIIHRLPLAGEDNEKIKLDVRNIPDNDPPREFLLEMPEKITIQVTDSQVITRVDKTLISLVQEGDDDGVITVESGKSKVTISQDGDISVESEGQMSLKAMGDMSIEAPNISIKSDEEITIEAGTKGKFKTGAEASIESSAPLDIKSGGTAKFEASGAMDIKGSMVNIN